MSTADILLLGDNRLKEAAAPVQNYDGILSDLVETMFATMTEAKGIGLAAPQIGVMQQVIVARIKDGGTETRYTLINPVITHASEVKVSGDEGCLSIPGVRLNVERSAEIDVHYKDVLGVGHELHATGLLAVCLQHEIDHLHGTLIIDRVSKLRRDRAKTQFTKFLRQRL